MVDNGQNKQGFDEMEEEIETITLEMMEGSTVECEILETLEKDDKMYVALLPLDKEEYFVFECKIGENEGEIEIINIEDEEKISEVYEAFDELFHSYEDDDDYEDYDEDDDEEENEEVDDDDDEEE